LRWLTYIPALLLADTVIMFRRWCGVSSPTILRADVRKAPAPLPPKSRRPRNRGLGLRQRPPPPESGPAPIVTSDRSIRPATHVAPYRRDIEAARAQPLIARRRLSIRGVDEVEADAPALPNSASPTT
jgi:hypothetical protein